MTQDLHTHTYYSFCGKDSPEAVVKTAISGGIEVLGICDHNYGVGYGRRDAFCLGFQGEAQEYQAMVKRYYDHINLVRERYKGIITILCGIEICTLQDRQHRNYILPENVDISFFDYCLIENLDEGASVTNGDLFTFAKRCGTPMVGVAHTDLFAFIERIGANPLDYFGQMAREHIFWELNVNYDSIHRYQEHKYVQEFFRDEEKQEIVRNSGVCVSIGFDGHRVEDYLPNRVTDYCERLERLGIKKPCTMKKGEVYEK